MWIFKPLAFGSIFASFFLLTPPVSPAAHVLSGSYVRRDSSTLDVRALSGGRVTFHLVALGGGTKSAPDIEKRAGRSG